MLRFSDSVLPLRLQAAILSMMIAVLIFASAASAALLDFQPPTGDYNVAVNWLDYTTSTNAVPTTADEAIVRNGGTLNITAADGDASAAVIRIGAGPQSGDPVGPPFYGGDGTLNWTGGNILGFVDNVTPANSTGPRINVGQRDNTNDINYTGIVNHSGGKISLNTNASFLVVGSSGNTPTPTSVYNLSSAGIIALTIGSGNTNNGINVRNGTFNMTGGSIEDDPASAGFGQRAMTISSSSGPDAANPNVATANISGGTWETRGGIRMAANSRSSAYLNISGTADIKVKSDVNMTNNATDAYAELNMSGGSLKIGESVAAPTNEANLIVGDRAVGVMNLSGGTVNISRDLRISNDAAGSGGGAGQGTIMMTGGTMTARNLDMRLSAPTSAANYATGTATFIIDGPTASFTQANTTLTGSTTIGNTGISLFEVRQGFASLGGASVSQPTAGNIELAKTATAAATLNVKGGRLVINGNVNRTNTTPGVIAGPLAGLGAAPVVGLTGGVLELNVTPATMNWQTDFTNAGSQITTKSGAKLTVFVGAAGTHPGNFEMNSGSWDLDIEDIHGFSANGSDRFVVNGTGGSGKLLGGTLNLNYLGAYSPLVGDSRTIVRVNGGGGVMLGSISINAPGADPNWITEISGNDILLTYVPEPASCVLMFAGLAVGMIVRCRRS